jgi:RNA polymerase sigma factor (sigma-70 family)
MGAISTDGPLSDERLLQACRAGDAKGWSGLLDKYERLVYSIPLNYGLSRDDAADIAQIVFTSLLQSLDTLREDSNLAGWLATVARRHSWRMMTRRRTEQLDPLDNDDVHSLFPAHTGEADRVETAEWLHGGLAQLDERCRQLLLALYFDPDELSYGDIAARLGMAEGSIGPTRARCLQRLRHLLVPGAKPA